LIVAGRLVGVRLHPRDKDIRKLAPAGIEFAPPRKEVSTGPGRHDFEIVADASLSVEDDMRRRDFTVNAMARRLATGELVDPLDGKRDLERRVLRTVSPTSFAEDPLRLVRALRFVSQLDFDPDESTLRQMRDEAASVKLVSGERIGGGLAADGMGELSKLLLGTRPAKAFRLARDTGVLVELLPEFKKAIGFDQESRYHSLTVDEHTFAVVQAAADAGYALPVRLATVFHDLGKPYVAWRGTDARLHYYAKRGFSERSHEQVGCELAREALLRLRYPNALRDRVVRIVRYHMFQIGKGDALRARRFLAKHGDELAFQLVDHKEADYRGKPGPDGLEAPVEDLEKLARFRKELQAERRQPHRLSDLAIDGTDLIELGLRPGPDLGRVLRDLLHDVVENPSLNTREVLLARAREVA
jgi:tRNA nucleotidyltransferase (CCA-adding enzyme)